jgi:hypothetical protein
MGMVMGAETIRRRETVLPGPVPGTQECFSGLYTTTKIVHREKTFNGCGQV